MQTEKGLIVLSFYEEQGMALALTQHLLNRYKERVLKVCDWKLRNKLNMATDDKDLITTFVSRNSSLYWVQTSSVYGNKYHIFSPCTDGVILAQWDNKHKRFQANTFVTFDMLDNKQMEMVHIAKNYSKLSEEERAKVKVPDFVNDKSNG